MRVKLKLFAGLRQYLPAGEFPYDAELSNNTTVGAALDSFSVPQGVPRILLVNGRHAEVNTVLREGDVLSVFPPVAGG